MREIKHGRATTKMPEVWPGTAAVPTRRVSPRPDHDADADIYAPNSYAHHR